MDELDQLSPAAVTYPAIEESVTYLAIEESVTYPAIEEMEMNLVSYEPEPEPASPIHEAFLNGEEVEALLDATIVYKDSIDSPPSDSPTTESMYADTPPLLISDTGISEFLILAEEYAPRTRTSEETESAPELLYSYLQDALLVETDNCQDVPSLEVEAAMWADMTAHDETAVAMTTVAETASPAEAAVAVIEQEKAAVAVIEHEAIVQQEADAEESRPEVAFQQDATVEEIGHEVVIQQEVDWEEICYEVVVQEEAEVEAISHEPVAPECAEPIDELPTVAEPVDELPTVDDSNAAPPLAEPIRRPAKKSKRKTTTRAARKPVIPYAPVAVRPRAKRSQRHASGNSNKMTRWITKSTGQSGDPTSRKKRQEAAYLKPLFEVRDFDQALKLIGEVDEILVDLTITAEVKAKITAAVVRLEAEIATVEEFARQVQRSRQAAEIANTVHCLSTLLAAFPAKPASFLNFKDDFYLDTRSLVQEKVATIIQRLAEQAPDHQCWGCSVCRSLEELSARLRDKGLDESAQQCRAILSQVNNRREERNQSLDPSIQSKGRKPTTLASGESGIQQDCVGRATPSQLASPKLGCYIWWQ
jgi:hypothetical protein